MGVKVFLELKNITKAFPGVLALDKVSFSAHRGEVHALCGENGAGKSTLMKIINGIYKADSGEIYIEGMPVT
ncbi:MAG: ATP-binding cassette domain-containing protein, partial [Treponema sp.]|nr:ATP-binding cassette domain-containing protein [Treponema sp.]